MDLIVTGGRDYSDYVMVQDVLDKFDFNVLIQGGATGADALARQYAEDMKIDCITIHAEWSLHGKRAGPLRNTEMLIRYPNAVVVAFLGGRGTADCVKQAVSRNMIVLEVK